LSPKTTPSSTGSTLNDERCITSTDIDGWCHGYAAAQVLSASAALGKSVFAAQQRNSHSRVPLTRWWFRAQRQRIIGSVDVHPRPPLVLPPAGLQAPHQQQTAPRVHPETWHGRCTSIDEDAAATLGCRYGGRHGQMVQQREGLRLPRS